MLTSSNPRLLTTAQAAQYLGVSAWTVRQLVHRGRIRRTMIRARGWHIDLLDLNAFIEHQKEYGGRFR